MRGFPPPGHNETTWGGSIALDPVGGAYHMFVAEMVNECPLNSWGQNSRCTHAVASAPEGPYVFADVSVPTWCHNPAITLQKNADGSFTEHDILGKTKEDNADGKGFSQIHAVQLEDINGDGLPDIVCGKRRWAHGIKGDDEPNADPVLNWFELNRDGKGGATFVPRKIDNDSGVGTQFFAGKVNQDNKPDIVIANKHGVFVFTQK